MLESELQIGILAQQRPQPILTGPCYDSEDSPFPFSCRDAFRYRSELGQPQHVS